MRRKGFIYSHFKLYITPRSTLIDLFVYNSDFVVMQKRRFSRYINNKISVFVDKYAKPRNRRTKPGKLFPVLTYARMASLMNLRFTKANTANVEFALKRNSFFVKKFWARFGQFFWRSFSNAKSKKRKQFKFSRIKLFVKNLVLGWAQRSVKNRQWLRVIAHYKALISKLQKQIRSTPKLTTRQRLFLKIARLLSLCKAFVVKSRSFLKKGSVKRRVVSKFLAGTRKKVLLKATRILRANKRVKKKDILSKLVTKPQKMYVEKVGVKNKGKLIKTKVPLKKIKEKNDQSRKKAK